VFGRRRREEAAAEAAREAERRDLFARLAERPEHICPFLGLAKDRTGYVDGVSDEHRCYAFGDPAPLSAEQQTRVCQERGYGNCPRYLRGVLVIPTEELEALRRPRPMPDAPPPVVAEPRRRRRAALLPLLLLLLVVGGGAAAGFIIFGGGLIGGGPDETATPTVAPTVAPPSIEPSSTPQPSQSASASVAPSPTPDPTPTAGDVFTHYEVSVSAGDYTLYAVAPDGALAGSRDATFSRSSQATVDRIVASNGVRHWRTTEGEYAGLSYIFPDSGPFNIREVYRRPDGARSSELLPEDEL
jgi:hypothetical protein